MKILVKRLLTNLEPFNTTTLDFSKIASVGQGFADEVFRVYQLSRPDVKISYIHANPEVEFMIKRAIKTHLPLKNNQ